MNRHSAASLAKATAKLQAVCDKFNNANPVGAAVSVLLDGGEVRQTVTTSEAQVLSGHSAVIWLQGIVGCYLLDRVTPLLNLIQPMTVQRDSEGWWCHPGLPEFDEDHQAYNAWMIAQGLETRFHALENEDETSPAYISYYDHETSDVSEWDDEAPQGEGWFTLSIHDSEDGPQWVWVRRVGTEVLMARIHEEALKRNKLIDARRNRRAGIARSTSCDASDDVELV